MSEVVTLLASVDGQITPTDEAMIPADDDGLRRGDGVFEVVRLYGGFPFARREHLDRLARSAGAIELALDADAVERELDALLEAAGPGDGQLRIVVTRAGRRVLFTEHLIEHADAVSLATVRYRTTIILDGVKSLSYAANMQATRLARARGGDEALLVDPDDIVMEAPTSSVFWVATDGTLRTPPIDVGILESITRTRLVEALDVDAGARPLSELIDAREAFLASTTREVQAVSAVDGHALGDAPGPRTREAIEAFAAIVADELAGRRP